MPYRFLEDIATADVAFEAWGATREEVFRQCAEALLGAMLEEPDRVGRDRTLIIRLEHEELDLLLFSFLNELVYYKDSRKLLLHAERITLTWRDGIWRLEAEAAGELIDPARHRLVVDVKAITLHRLALVRSGDVWQATVVVDV